MAKKASGAADVAAELRAELHRHDKLYYTYGEPEISDTAYDRLMIELLELEALYPAVVTDDSPTKRVGGEPIDGFETVEHPQKMYSIDNCFDLDAVKAWHKKVTSQLGHAPKYTIDYKIDGCAASLVYTDGKFVRLVTRGDGVKGDDITNNAVAIRGIPMDLLPVWGVAGKRRGAELLADAHYGETIEIRGEVFIRNTVFKQIRAAQLANGEEPFANPRNAVSGALRNRDPKECFRRGTEFVAHGFNRLPSSVRVNSYFMTMCGYHTLGVPIIEDCDGKLPFAAVLALIERMTAIRDDNTSVIDDIDYPIDGIVLKVDGFDDRDALGQKSSKHVSWAIAYKWKRYEAQTTVDRLEVQVGKTGAITPVAYFKPVEIAGTTVGKATLHNFNMVADMGIGTGDTVTVEKAGKIIPRVVRVDKHSKAKSRETLSVPTVCPSCGDAVEADGAYYRCVNDVNCPDRLVGLIVAAADRSRLDIDSLGDVLARSLVDTKLVTTLADLWRLEGQRAAVEALPRMGKKSTDRLLKALHEAKRRPSWRLLASLSIPGCGRTVSERLIGSFGSIGNLGKAGMAVLMNEPGIGAATGASLATWFDDENNQQLLVDLLALDLNLGVYDFSPDTEEPATEQTLAGKKIVATGKLVNYTREGIKKQIKRRGGTAAGSISRSVDYLVAGKDAGGKLKTARALGVTVITEEEFDALVIG